MKDNFSTQSDSYARYRPTYPPEFFEYLYSLLPVKKMPGIAAQVTDR
ncbi:hypothetical protein [Mucilaginibacter aquatilis]|nr:hypothetical protein [Mucilaginibacter aquatilis]